MIIQNGNIATPAEERPFARAFAMMDGRFLAVGSRGGLNLNTELRWDVVPSLSDALTMLRE